MVTDGSWEGKGTAVFYLELTLDLLHLIIYAIFFGVVFSTYGIPIYLVSAVVCVWGGASCCCELVESCLLHV